MRRQPFFVPVDISSLKFGRIANESYEATVLFMVANFQYMSTCIAFSIAEPFRRPIWTNIPFFVCLCLIFVFNSLCVFLPSDNWFSNAFNLLPFKTKDGTSYYSWRYWIALGILINFIVTYATEKLIVNVITRKADARKLKKKEAAFKIMMEQYRALVKDKENEFTDRDEDNNNEFGA